MTHLLLALDDDLDPTKTDLLLRPDPDDATCFAVLRSGTRELGGIGFLATVGAPTFVLHGAPTLIRRVMPADIDDPAGE